MSTEGAVLFAQFAYPPNELGYCGPAGAAAMLDPLSVADIGRRARGFDGAWSYLEFLAEAAGFTDPLALDVVEAYWVGNDLLASVDPARLVTRLEDRFRGQPWGTWREAAARASPHHSFQVYEVYPWAGLLRAGRPPGPAVQVLDDCRIRVGKVHRIAGESVLVSTRHLAWSDPVLAEGRAVTEVARWSVGGYSLIDTPQPGDLVALHWDWVCAVISAAQADQIQDRERSALRAVGFDTGQR